MCADLMVKVHKNHWIGRSITEPINDFYMQLKWQIKTVQNMFVNWLIYKSLENILLQRHQIISTFYRRLRINQENKYFQALFILNAIP